MNQYRRIVSYLYKYDNGKKGENTGFVRIDTRAEGIRLHFRIKDMRMMDERRLKMYFYFHKENRLQLVFVDEFLCVRGNCEYKKMVFPDFTDRDFEKINGVVFLDGQGLLYGSCWDEREISEELFEEKENIEAEEEENAEEKEEEKEKEEEVVLKTAQMESDGEIYVEQKEEKRKTEDIFFEFPSLMLDHSEGGIQAVRIRIEDISMLPMKEWKLADNAFLKQAYDKDPHLLLGKVTMPNESEVWILGVPGSYENREKYLAGIFGFSDYIPLEKNREYKTGGKGYWIRQIESVN